MAEYSCPHVLTSSGGSVTFNVEPTSVGFHDPDMCDGLEQKPMRSVTENRPRAHGGIVYPRLYAPRPIVLGGWIRSTSLSGREAFFAGLEDRLEELMTAAGTLQVQASTGTVTYDVWADVGLKGPGKWIKKYQFSLMAPDD